MGWMGIGGEGGKSRPCWIGEGCDVIFLDHKHITVKRLEAEVKCQIFYYFILHKKRKNLPDRVFYRRERGPGPSVTAGVPFCDFLCGKKVSRNFEKKSHAFVWRKMSRNKKQRMSQKRKNQGIGPHCPAEGSKKFQACLFPGSRCPPSLMWMVNIFR